MTYTEIKERNKKKYFYRVLSIRNKKIISKKRKYLGVNLSQKDLSAKEKEADKELKPTNMYKINVSSKLISSIIRILKKNNVKKAGIFGSYARGEQTEKSDIDLLIEPPKDIGFGFVKIQIELQDKLNKKIDLVSYNGISPYLKDKILNEEVKII
ncbi:MAG: nucleotidyltransferase family protein [Nanoarchaeota archaeon]